jgi:hypothetical protein
MILRWPSFQTQAEARDAQRPGFGQAYKRRENDSVDLLPGW